jgi:GMP synthase-like glutamine amidotransferase
MKAKVGLLICDHVADEFKHIDGEYLDMFRKLLPSLELEPYYVVDGHFPQSVDDHNAYVCNGSMYSVYHPAAWIVSLKDFVYKIGASNKKFVGVCFGHQMIAHAMGGVVQKAPVGWCVGAHTFKIVSKEAWMQPAKETCNVLMLCQDQVTKLPKRSRVLATSPDCEIGMYLVNECMLGIQGHPEFSREYNEALIIKRKDRIGKVKANAAIDSFYLPIHDDTITRWITNFIAS